MMFNKAIRWQSFLVCLMQPVRRKLILTSSKVELDRSSITGGQTLIRRRSFAIDALQSRLFPHHPMMFQFPSNEITQKNEALELIKSQTTVKAIFLQSISIAKSRETFFYGKKSHKKSWKGCKD